MLSQPKIGILNFVLVIVTYMLQVFSFSMHYFVKIFEGVKTFRGVQLALWRYM